MSQAIDHPQQVTVALKRQVVNQRKNTIKIRVSGPAGSGKSAICQLINQALQLYAYQVQLPDGFNIGKSDWRSYPDHVKALNSASQHSCVVIEEVQPRRKM